MTVIEIDHARTRARAAGTGSSTPVVPQSVKGPIRRIKWAVLIVTLTIYYLAPFLRWERGIGEPNQAILLDFEHGRLYAFFIAIWPQELYYVTGLLILAATILILTNALAGRLWCGLPAADGLDRPVHAGGAENRRRPPRSPQEDRRPPDAATAR